MQKVAVSVTNGRHLPTSLLARGDFVAIVLDGSTNQNKPEVPPKKPKATTTQRRGRLGVGGI